LEFQESSTKTSKKRLIKIPHQLVGDFVLPLVNFFTVELLSHPHMHERQQGLGELHLERNIQDAR
jgi:hypothetical protein